MIDSEQVPWGKGEIDFLYFEKDIET